FRAGMIGAGNIAEFHVAAVKAYAAAHPDEVELIGVADLDHAKASAQAEKWGTQAFASLDALVAAGANVIHILTPPSSHAKLAYDEWRALVRCKRGLGQFQLSWNTKPMQSQIIIHGTKGVLRVDLFAMFHGKRASTPLPKAAERLINAFADSLQPLVDVPINVWKFVRKEVQAYQGLRDLVTDFYRRLAAGEPPPVSIEDAAQVVR